MDKRLEKKLAHADAMARRLQPPPTGVKTVPTPRRTDEQTWAELVKINDALRGNRHG